MLESRGILIFATLSAGASIVLLRKRVSEHQNEQFNAGVHKLSKEKSNSNAFITRNESEFSLGLGRSKSLPSLMSELGELCDAGKTVVNISKAVTLLAVGVFSLSFVGYGVSLCGSKRFRPAFDEEAIG